MKKKSIVIVAMLTLLVALAACDSGQQKKETADSGYSGIDVASPEWVGKLAAAKDAQQMLIVSAFSNEATDAWISLHEKQDDGSWHMIMAKQKKEMPRHLPVYSILTVRSVSLMIPAVPFLM